MTSITKTWAGSEVYSEHTESDHGLTQERLKLSFSAKAKRHCRRFWWLDILLFTVILLVIILPVIFVGLGNVAQSQLNKATVNVTYQGIRNPTPDSIKLILNTTIMSDSKYKPDIQSFNASFFLENTEPNIKPFGYLQIPTIHGDPVTEVDLDQNFKIANMDQFTAFTKLVLSSYEFRVALQGKTKVSVKGLPDYEVDYNKVATMKGLNKLSGFAITSTQLKLTPEPDGATMLGTVSIPNPSVFSVDMGNVTMNLFSRGVHIGYTLIQDMTLNPGNNSFDMRSYVDLAQAVNLVEAFDLPLDIVGNSSVNAAGQHLPYFEAAMRENTIHYNLRVVI